MARNNGASKKQIAEKARERFWSHVRKTKKCWLWTHRSDKDGYGKFFHTRRYGAHRYSFLLTYGFLPKGLHVLHKCDNPPCVRPSHLFLGTQQDNSDDMVAKGRGATGLRNARYTHPETTARGDRSGPRTFPERRPRGSAHYAAKLNEAKVRLLRSEYRWGAGNTHTLAKKYGVSQLMVSKIIRRVSWRHV